MKKLIAIALIAAFNLVWAGPKEDLEKFRTFFEQKFPGLALDEYVNGAYALDADKRMQWEAMEEFPPYEDYVYKGEEIWETPFANGKSFKDCFGDDPSKVRVQYPYWNKYRKEVITLELAINECLEKNGEKPFPWKKGKIAHLAAFFGYEARGQKINVIVPEDDPDALAAYEAGKQFYFAKRGQLNMACADCHIYYAGHFIRGQLLSPAIGQVTHFPVWRGKWERKSKNGDGLGTLHRRYGGCNKQVRARPFKAQSKEYRNLEYFHTYLSNGLEINAPGYRE